MPSDVRFAEVQRLLEKAGYELVQISGSHHIFDKAGHRPISIPVHHGKVKYVYVRQIKKGIEGN